MTKDKIQDEFEGFFGYTGHDKGSVVTSYSAKIFAKHIANMAVAEEREACADACEIIYYVSEDYDGRDCAEAIRARNNEVEQ